LLIHSTTENAKNTTALVTNYQEISLLVVQNHKQIQCINNLIDQLQINIKKDVNDSTVASAEQNTNITQNFNHINSQSELI